MPDQQDGKKWLTIDTFPGIFSMPGSAGDDATSTVLQGFNPFTNAPLGALTDNSYGVVPGVGGKGLIPGPGILTSTEDLTIDVANFADANKQAPYYVTGVVSPQPGATTSILAVGMWYFDSGGVGRWKLMLMSPDGGTEILGRTVSTGASNVYRGNTFAMSRMNTASPYTSPGNPVLAYGVQGWEAGVYPDPTAAGVNGVATFAVSGKVIAHQNRVLLLAADGAYSFGTLTNLTGDGEKVRYTDPPNSNVMGTQDAVFYPEMFSGYVAWGSLSAAALFLVKAAGGAVLVQGDVNAPQITYLPGVRSGGQICSNAGNTSIGIVYGTEDGVYAWAGGASSIKISPQLEALFWTRDAVSGSALPQRMGSSTSFQAFEMNDFILVSGSWAFHVATQTWWRIGNPTSRVYQWYAYSGQSDGTPRLNSFWAVFPRGELVSGTTYMIGHRMSFHHFAKEWRAEFHPFVLTENQDVDIDELVIECQAGKDSGGTQTITWTLTDSQGSTQTGSVTVTAEEDVQRFVIPVGSGGNTVRLKLDGANDSTGQIAPMIHRIHIGYTPTNLAPLA